MSAVIETFLICDGGCGENFGVDYRVFTAKMHRKNAKKQGWIHRKGKDYCPDCKNKPI